ncbi:MAG TPA: cell division protein FtsZ [bacterium]|nr:cell division protein FtsZ [bacterium]
MEQTKSMPLVRIGVVGVGGAGGNAINRIVDERDRLAREGGESVFSEVTLIAANTDAQDLGASGAARRVQLGVNKTKGRGAGSCPEVGRESAEENRVDIANTVDGIELLFITAGMGGGTGTGASPIIAEVARAEGALVVGVVTTPFRFEGKHKMKVAQAGLDRLREQVDALVVIPNEKLLTTDGERLGVIESFRRSDEVLISAVRSVSTIIAKKSLINIDFADLCHTMRGMGTAMIGIGSATGENAAVNAIKEALGNPLMSDVSIKGARRALLHIGGMQIALCELDEAAKYLEGQLHEEANLIWGAAIDETADKIQVLVIAEASPATAPAVVRPADAALRNVPKNAQVSLLDMANAPAAAPQEAKAPPAPVEPPPLAIPSAAVARQALPEVKGVFREKERPVRLDYSEKILVHLPDETPPDPNNKEIPAYLRPRLTSRQKNGEPPAPRPPAPPRRQDERQTVLQTFTGAANNKNGDE